MCSAEDMSINIFQNFQRRQRWQDTKSNIKVGDLVLLLDENTHRRLWPLSDGLVMSVRVKTKSTELVRPLSKIVSLEVLKYGNPPYYAEGYLINVPCSYYT